MLRHRLLDTNTLALNDVFTNGRRYKVPEYQRDYSWKEENWDDLWADIMALGPQKDVHYMGAIVLQDHTDKTFTIIDGQQRLATLSLIALAVIKRLQDLIDAEVDVEENAEHKEELIRLYVGGKDAVSLRYSNKLTLNENNNSFYESFLVQLREPINEHRLNSSNKLLLQAFLYFYAKICDRFGPAATGEQLAEFLQNHVSERLIFIQILVEDAVSAYTVFETLNARGVELTVTDLLKNYLLSLCAQSEIDKQQALQQWKRVIEITDLKAFPKFLRYYWNSRNDFVRKDGLFKALRNHVRTAESSFSLLDKLEKNAAVYAALEDPNDTLWAGNREIRRRITELRLFGVTQPYPLLLLAFEKLSIGEFETVLRFCAVIGFRYNVIGGLNPNKQEEVFNDAARKLYYGTITSTNQIAQALKDIYPRDDDFAHNFSNKEVNTRRNKKLARYILYALETQVSEMDRNFEEETGTIEHILPENPPVEWESSFSQELQPSYIYRIGNLALLETGKNSECQDRGFDEKQAVYQTSCYSMTNSFDYPEWTPTQVNSRQRELARLATSIWRIAQISS